MSPLTFINVNDNLRQQSIVLFNSYYSSGDSYPMKALSDIATIKYGKGLPTKELLPTGFPVFGGNGIIGSYNSYLYETPQILVSCRGAASGNILVSYPKSFVTNNSLVLELNDYRYFHFIKQYLLENPLYSYATGSAQPQITIDNIKDVQVPYPEYDSIHNLIKQLSYYADMQYHNICENSLLCSTRDTLLPRLMSGEIDVSGIDL
ncbi:restriction endonuclease subunit S [Lachnobacterium bovis]|nr:restriction endonuclease subunit S [Lachnobacterium bovis]